MHTAADLLKPPIVIVSCPDPLPLHSFFFCFFSEVAIGLLVRDRVRVEVKAIGLGCPLRGVPLYISCYYGSCIIPDTHTHTHHNDYRQQVFHD